MIKGFEEITKELTDYEKKTLLPIIAAGLQSKVGKANAITNKKMVVAMKAQGYKVSEPRIRKIIHAIRIGQIVKNVISTSKGYHVATSQEEVKDYVQSLKERMNSIEQVYKSFQV